MITYTTLPGSKKPTKFAFLKPFKSKIRKLQTFTYSPLILLVGVLVSISSVAVGAALLSKGQVSLFGGNPKINSLSTSQTIPSGILEIKGHNFGSLKPTDATLPGNVVFTGKDEESSSPDGVSAMVISWAHDKITVYVPPEAKSGYVYVVSRQDKETLKFSNGQKVTIKTPQPKISLLSTGKSRPSDIVQIKGEGFGNFMGATRNFPSGRPSNFPGNVVFEVGKDSFNVDVLSWTDHVVEIYTPSQATKGELKVNLQFGEETITSNQVGLEIIRPEPKLAGLDKSQALPTEQITLEGKNFGKTMTNPLGLLKFPGHVYFGDTEAMVENWNEAEINVYLPTAVKVGQEKVKVVLDYLQDGVGTEETNLMVGSPNPKLEIAPGSAFPSEQVTLNGSGFGDQISSNRYGVVFPGRVFFSTTDGDTPDKRSNPAPILNWSDSVITVNVPVGVTTGKIFVARTTGSRDFYSKGVSFNPKTPVPQIDNLSTYNAQPGELITIYGSNLGTQMGTQKTAISYPGRVMVDDKNALPALDGWHDNQISFYLPWGVKNGTLKVQLQSGGQVVSSNEKKIDVSYQKPKIDKATLLNNDKNQLSLRGQDFGNVVLNPYVGSFKPGKVFVSMEEEAKGNNLKVLGASRVEAKIESWQNDKVTFTLPKNSRSGYLYVTLEGNDGPIISNSFPYPKD